MSHLDVVRRGVAVLSILSVAAVILAALLFGFLLHVLLPTQYERPLLFLDVALTAFGLLTIHARRGDALGALNAVEAVARGRKPTSSPATRRARADVVRNLLDKAAEAVLGPLSSTVVGVPLGLGFVAAVAHMYGRHEVVASVCGGIGVLCLLVGTAPYFVARYLLDRQIDRVAGMFDAGERQPLLGA